MNILCYKINQLFGFTSSPKNIGKDKPQKWYGRVNFWMNMTASKKDIEACVKYHLDGYMIEMAGWSGSAGAEPWSDAWISKIESNYKKLVKLCRAAGIWLFVSIVNDNMGQGKYGDKNPKLEKVIGQAKKLVAIVKSAGKDNVIVQPVAETQTTAGKQFDTYCKSELANFQLVYNGQGGQPTNNGGMNFRAYHPSSVGRQIAGDAFAVSDHGAIIKELANNTYDGPVNPQKVTAWYNNIKSWGCPVMGYYAFLVQNHDKFTIQTIGNL